MQKMRLVWTLFHALLAVQAKPFLGSRYHAKNSKTTTTTLTNIRGGSTTTTEPTTDPLQAYRIQQQLYLQSRSLQLRQALLSRGLTELQHSETETTAQLVDWDCALATKDEPKSCLYSFDAQTGSKVICPMDTNQWITLAALNRLRRNDPTKVEPLWHSQYKILQGWFHPSQAYSLYTHLSPAGTLLACLLDAPWLLGLCMGGVFLTALLVTLPVWEGLVKWFLTSPLLWNQWHQWGRFLHAALPLKLLLGQMAWKFLANVFGMVYGKIRGQLVEWECQMLEACTPLTILPRGMEWSSEAESVGDLVDAEEDEVDDEEEEEEEEEEDLDDSDGDY